jgi:hypothetical protein
MIRNEAFSEEYSSTQNTVQKIDSLKLQERMKKYQNGKVHLYKYLILSLNSVFYVLASKSFSSSFNFDDDDTNFADLTSKTNTFSAVAKLFRQNLLSSASDSSNVRKKLQAVFKKLDTDKNGIITTAELTLLLQELDAVKGADDPLQTLDLLVEQIDINRFQIQHN